jgi:hypothetical protein
MNKEIIIPVQELKAALPGLSKIVSRSRTLPVIQSVCVARDAGGKSHVTFEWSHDCSKPRVDAYGGGAAFITAKEIKTMSTSAWLNEQIA